MTTTSAVQYVVDAAARGPHRPALWVDGESFTYRQLMVHARRLARELRDVAGPVCATLGERSLTAYCAPLACMLAGKIHVPLGASFPQARMLDILQRTAPVCVIADTANTDVAQALLDALEAAPGQATRPVLIAPDAWYAADEGSGGTGEDDAANTHGTFAEPDAHPGAVAATASPDARRPEAATIADTVSGLPVSDDAIAYVLFTSGSTGRPKGVAVGHAALRAYVETVLARYPELDAQQRCTQFFEPTFDLSMHDMFVTWAAGACLYSVPKSALLMPTDFVNAHRLTVWFSVPSLAATLQRYRLLGQDTFPTLRLALFCGEALPGPLADAWRMAAPHARCENIYGPTEATIACTGHPFGPTDAPHAVVPIGTAFAGMEIAVVDAEGTPCARGTDGELWLGGRQLAFGYWQDAKQTDERFVENTLPGHAATRWYRTGDLARIDTEGTAHYRGRLDRQIKLRGYRIELQEIEAHLRTACAARTAPAEVAVVAIAPGPGEPATGIAAFVVQDGFDAGATLATMKQRVPAYMVPDQIHALETLPLNSNGKIDYPALAAHVRSTPATPRRRRRPDTTTTSEAPQ